MSAPDLAVVRRRLLAYSATLRLVALAVSRGADPGDADNAIDELAVELDDLADALDAEVTS